MSDSEADSGGNQTDGGGIGGRLRRWIPPSTRSLAGRYAVVVVLVFVLVAAGGGYLTYDVRTAPETELQTQTVGTWQANTTFTHGAVVTNESIVFERGERLEDRPLYFTRLSPVMDGEYAVTHDGDTEAAVGTVDLRLVLRATEEVETDDGETRTVTHWRQTDPIATEGIDGLAPGETHTVDFEANATELGNRLDRIEENLSASPGTREVVVVADTTLETEVEGERFLEERTDRLRVEPGGGTYSVGSEIDSSDPYEATATVEVPIEHSAAERYGGPALIAIGLLGAFAVGVLTYGGVFAVSPAERRRLTFQRAREDYDEWISRGTLPDESADRVIELDGLEDVVDTAIDSDRRVVERVEPTPRYATIVDDVEYRFDPPEVVAEAVSPAAEGAIDVAVADAPGTESGTRSDPAPAPDSELAPDAGSDGDGGNETDENANGGHSGADSVADAFDPAGDGPSVHDGDGEPRDR